jgi:hypothetical protein
MSGFSYFILNFIFREFYFVKLRFVKLVAVANIAYVT